MNEFNISKGNLEVLKRIPEMMEIEKYRDILRKLVVDFIIDSERKYEKESSK